MYMCAFFEVRDNRHPQQRKAIARKNQLLGIVQDQQGISRDDLIAVCYNNFGWFPRTTGDHIKMMLKFGSLKQEENQLFTHDYKPKDAQTKLEDVLAVAEEKIALNSEKKMEGV